ncbi:MULTISPECIES: outer membrane channel protein TolC [Alteromonadaceae]|uniref:outer membrane channel protein TolC n=1 Tax=Alteromonadaceae TaxID=72275 RepID=UPI001C086890|nr:MULTISPECIES: outer membrane channel protein TolC [Aliiglaciecola]MBU2878703.1 outer membrane channel protein TolC [Aliiglaciecola lipolytica]MDO6709468.1 outer membrane channel protein TolC [Aliiglaciecola sp. 2_MG-2023]MDO6750990.1 outer membrane channel protein TolC [Aliiglaciecola sp. 1_MG-2023]
MKKSILSLLIGFSVATQAYADDLYQVYQRALEQDPTINKAKADRDAAFEGISISRANLLPQVSGVISYSKSSQESLNYSNDSSSPSIITTDTTNLGWDINLSLSVYDHKNWVGLNRAEKIAQQSDTTFALAKQELIVRTTIAYLAVLRAKDGLEFVQAEKRAIERQLEQTKQRFEVGLTAITDVHEAQANFDNTVAQEIVAENLVELRLEELREITGKYHDNLSVLNTESFSASRPIPERVDGWLSIAEEKNLDLMVSKLATEIAKDDIKHARAGHYPTVSLTASIGSDDTEVLGIDLPARDNDSIGLSLNVPIYSGGSVSSQTAQAKYNFIAASENLELTHRSTVRSIRSSYNDVVAATSTIRAFEQAVISAQSALQATEAGFDVGTRTIVDVLNSTRNLFDARRNLASARYDFISAVMTLKRSAGNLTEQDLEDINRGLRPAS